MGVVFVSTGARRILKKKHEQSFGAKVAMNMSKGLYGIFTYIQKFT